MYVHMCIVTPTQVSVCCWHFIIVRTLNTHMALHFISFFALSTPLGPLQVRRGVGARGEFGAGGRDRRTHQQDCHCDRRGAERTI